MIVFYLQVQLCLFTFDSVTKKPSKKTNKKISRRQGRPRLRNPEIVERYMLPQHELPEVDLPRCPKPPKMPPGAGALLYGTGKHHVGNRFDDELMAALEKYASDSGGTPTDALRFLLRWALGLDVYMKPSVVPMPKIVKVRQR